MSLSDDQFLFLQYASRLINWCKENGHKIVGGELHRTQEQQDLYFASGRSKKKYSQHQDRLAIDLFLIVGDRMATPEEYRPLGEYWESLGSNLRWGGRYDVAIEDYGSKVGWDPNHFEFKEVIK